MRPEIGQRVVVREHPDHVLPAMVADLDPLPRLLGEVVEPGAASVAPDCVWVLMEPVPYVAGLQFRIRLQFHVDQLEPWRPRSAAS